jgi:hypothetical protein
MREAIKEGVPARATRMRWGGNQGGPQKRNQRRNQRRHQLACRRLLRRLELIADQGFVTRSKSLEGAYLHLQLAFVLNDVHDESALLIDESALLIDESALLIHGGLSRRVWSGLGCCCRRLRLRRRRWLRLRLRRRHRRHRQWRRHRRHRLRLQLGMSRRGWLLCAAPAARIKVFRIQCHRHRNTRRRRHGNGYKLDRRCRCHACVFLV